MAKLDRKKLLKEPDEFLTFSGRAIKWGREHSQKLIIGGSAILLAVAVTLGIQAYLNYRASQASRALAAVFDDFALSLNRPPDPAKAEAVAQNLAKVIEQYGATEAGMQARLALGEMWLHQGQFDQAEKALAALCEETDVPAPLLPLAQAGLGRCLEQRKKLAAAAEAYGNAAKAAGPGQAGIYNLDRARVLEAAGEKAAAENLYRELLGAGSSAQLAQSARQRLLAMGLELNPAAPAASVNRPAQPLASQGLIPGVCSSRPRGCWFLGGRPSPAGANQPGARRPGW